MTSAYTLAEVIHFLTLFSVRMRLYFSFIIFIGLSFGLNAQLLHNYSGEALTDHPYFDTAFVKRNKLASIKGHFVYYQLGHSPVDTKDFRQFFFNKKGQLIRRKEVQNFLVKDTAYFIYRYTKNGRLNLFGRFNAYGAYAYVYQFDKNGQKINEKFYQNSKARFGKNHPFSLRELNLIYTERSSYEEYAHQRIQTIYNSADKPYKKVYYYLDSLGRITGKTERLIRTKEVKETKYYYNKDELLDSLSITFGGNSKPDKSFAFGYDKDDNLLERLEYENGKFIYQTQVVYDRKGLFITNFLRQKVATKFMEILEVDEYKHFRKDSDTTFAPLH